MTQAQVIDIVKIAAAWGITTAIVLLGVFGSRPSRIPRTVYSAFVIAARLLFVYGVTFALFCVCLGVPVKILLIVYGVVLVLSPLARLDSDFAFPNSLVGDGLVGAALMMTIMIPVYILKQFVLGFPDYDEVILVPPESEVPREESHLLQKVGTVKSTLRPQGKVEVDGAVYSATSADGKYLDHGISVRIIEVRNSLLIVTVAGSH